jgi:hypothetical protein
MAAMLEALVLNDTTGGTASATPGCFLWRRKKVSINGHNSPGYYRVARRQWFCVSGRTTHHWEQQPEHQLCWCDPWFDSQDWDQQAHANRGNTWEVVEAGTLLLNNRNGSGAGGGSVQVKRASAALESSPLGNHQSG